MMSKAGEMNFLEEIQFGDGGVVISHLEYEDDTMIVGEKSWKNLCAIKATLQLFELVSELKSNFFKSLVVGVNIQQI